MDPLHHNPDQTAPAESPADEVMDPRLVEELLRALSTAVRSFRLYGGQSPMLSRFIDTLKQRLEQIFDHLPILRLSVAEGEIRWEDQVVHPTGAEAGDLAFLFYKDGIRELTLLQGLEDELEAFLAVLARAPQLRQEEDDLVTLLWEADLHGLRYEYVEPGQEAVDLPGGPGKGQPAPVDPEFVRSAAAQNDISVSPDDFESSLYFLDEAELRHLAAEVRRENERDLLGAVMNALFDRLEDGSPERQERIVGLIGELLPSLLSAARFDRSAHMLEELASLSSRGVLSPPALRAVRALFLLLADPATVDQLAQTLEDHPGELKSEALGQLLGFFPPESLAPLMRASERVVRPDVRRALERAIDELVHRNREEVVRLLQFEDAGVVASAARWVGRLGMGAAAGQLTALLDHADAGVRHNAVQALQQLRAAAAGGEIAERLGDEDRGVRIAAARALSALEYAPARDRLEALITGREMKNADRTEKLAIFESYGRLAGGDGVAVLSRILSSRGWFGRGESAEVRACAALALAHVRHPSARAALEAAADDNDPVVRTAVARALRGDAA